MSDEVHVSSLVVQALPEFLDDAREAVSAMPGIEVHAAEAGKMVVTLETADEGEIVARISEISLLDGVMAVNMVFHQVDGHQVDGPDAAD